MVANLQPSPSSDQADQAILAFVDSLGREELARFDRFQPKVLAHYLQCQAPWLQDEIYFLGQHLHREPSADEISRQILAGPQRLRFRAYYALRFPEAVDVTQSES